MKLKHLLTVALFAGAGVLPFAVPAHAGALNAASCTAGPYTSGGQYGAVSSCPAGTYGVAHRPRVTCRNDLRPPGQPVTQYTRYGGWVGATSRSYVLCDTGDARLSYGVQQQVQESRMR
ncbi:hypothetical protein Misp01_42820 [Microtetraspora sp. NBRC 13810]|nr:hypothetical protein Misp01_42820 [Microtetraspora sp. NBRC 13810]